MTANRAFFPRIRDLKLFLIETGGRIYGEEKLLTVRLSQAEVDALDGLTVGQFSRSQVMRIVLQDFCRRARGSNESF